jgi:hypothetical protein
MVGWLGFGLGFLCARLRVRGGHPHRYCGVSLRCGELRFCIDESHNGEVNTQTLDELEQRMCLSLLFFWPREILLGFDHEELKAVATAIRVQLTFLCSR